MEGTVGGPDEDFDWGAPTTDTSIQISMREFEAKSLRRPGGAGEHSLPRELRGLNLEGWFEGRVVHGTPTETDSAVLEATPVTGLDGEGDGTPESGELANGKSYDKAYVGRYMDELEQRIKEISRRPYVPQPSLVETSSIDSLPYPRAPAAQERDSVYSLVDMDCRNPSALSLAIHKHKDEILVGLQEHQVMIVEGFTGSGKTTQIPQYILDDLAYHGIQGNIVVTQPRRIAAQSVADRVCRERQWNVGELVGYQVGLNRKTSEMTRLTYVTTGVLLQTLISKKSLADYSHIIVDEVHERDLDTDLLILVIKKLMVETADRSTRIILMSATLNAAKFADYFPKWREGERVLESKIIRVPQTTFHKVNEYYIDTLERPLGRRFALQQTELMSHISDEPKLQSCTYDLAVQVLDGLDDFERRLNKPETERCGVLAFLPGLMEIDTMYKKCLEHIEQRVEQDGQDKLKWTLLPLHSSITAEEQQRVFHPCKAGYRKIILATNIAESSITVTDITFVIDFCLTKSMSCDPQTNYSCLRLEWASQDQCVQRRGRVGRVSEGHVFRMITRKAYNLLNKETVPDMEKACLENVVLSVKTLDLGSPTSVMALAIDPPAQSGIKLAISNLKEVGALTIDVDGVYKAYDGDLTMMGHLMAKLPFDIRYSRLIALGHIFGVLEETVIIAAGLSVKSAFSFPFTQRLLSYLSKVKWSNETFSDCFAIINLYRTWFKKNAAGAFRDYSSMRRWKQAYFVQTNVLREMSLCIQDVIRRLRNANIIVDPLALTEGEMSPDQSLMLKIVLAGAFYPNYFVRFRPDHVQYTRQVVRELNASDPMMSLVYAGFPNEQPGELYAAHIIQKYEGVNSAPCVVVNGSKAVVRFDDRCDKVGSLSLNLFRGVKLRQLRQFIQFRGIRCDVAKLVCEEERAYALKRLFPAPKQCPLPGITEKLVLVSVTRVISPNNFWVMYNQELQKYFELTEQLCSSIQRCRALKGIEILPGALCIAKVGNTCYRARVEFVTTDRTNVMLFLMDVGDIAWKETRECFAFSQELIDRNIHLYPAMGMNCRILGIKPLVRYSGTWSHSAAELMADVFASNNNRIVMDVHSVVDGIITCDIFGRNEDGTKDEGMRARLLGNELAAEMEEPNTDNENLRRNVHIIKFTADEIEHYNYLQRCDTTPRLVFAPATGKGCMQDYCLKGPFSPLEMTFRALSSSTHTKSVTVEGCSVNSVSLDQDPTSPAAVVLIAAGVGISQRSGSVILRETTILPPIPGLVAMLTMIFCPMMQLRAEGNKERFTGCLSGLGKDYSSGESVYADHDMEVIFDTVFDEEDIRTINEIRQTMNVVLNGAQEEHQRLGVGTMQQRVRRGITRLLERPRGAADEIYPQSEFVWSDDPNHQPPVGITPKGPGGRRRTNFRGRRNDVFPLHSLTVLPSPKVDSDSLF